MIKNMVFDIGNVLLRFAPHEWLCTWLDEDGAQAVMDALFHAPEWRMLDAGELDDAQAAARLCEKEPHLAGNIVRALREWPDCLTAIEPMHDLVRQCRAAGFSVYALTNFCIRCRNILADFPVFAELDGLLVSAEERMSKPEHRIYERFCERFSLSPAECFFIDDMPPNVAAAKACGWQGAVFTGIDELFPTLKQAGIIEI